MLRLYSKTPFGSLELTKPLMDAVLLFSPSSVGLVVNSRPEAYRLKG